MPLIVPFEDTIVSSFGGMYLVSKLFRLPKCPGADQHEAADPNHHLGGISRRETCLSVDLSDACWHIYLPTFVKASWKEKYPPWKMNGLWFYIYNPGVWRRRRYSDHRARVFQVDCRLINCPASSETLLLHESGRFERRFSQGTLQRRFSVASMKQQTFPEDNHVWNQNA